MIALHRLGNTAEFHLNPDLIQAIETTPDTVITLTNGARAVVAEPVDEVVAAIRAWRAAVLQAALDGRGRRATLRHDGPQLTVAGAAAAIGAEDDEERLR